MAARKRTRSTASSPRTTLEVIAPSNDKGSMTDSEAHGRRRAARVAIPITAPVRADTPHESGIPRASDLRSPPQILYNLRVSNKTGSGLSSPGGLFSAFQND